MDGRLNESMIKWIGWVHVTFMDGWISGYMDE